MTRRPVSLKEARRFVAEVHRHNKAVRGWKFGTGLELDGRLVAVAVAGRPTAPELDDGWTIEITRCTTDGTKNACSMLYGALCRAARALGYRDAFTYTLASEPGASLRAAGFAPVAEVPARANGSTGNRQRYDENLLGELTRPTEAKIRWHRRLT